MRLGGYRCSTVSRDTDGEFSCMVYMYVYSYDQHWRSLSDGVQAPDRQRALAMIVHEV